MIQLDMYGLKLKIFKPYNKIQIFVIKIFEMHPKFSNSALPSNVL